MNIGITGATGALGLRLTELLVEKKLNVRALVRKTSNIKKLSGLNINLVYGDINDKESLIDFVKDMDICIHIAAQVGNAVRQQFYHVNVTGTKNLCEAIMESAPGCRLIYCSSIVTLRVNFFNKFFYTDYTLSKYKAEKLVNKFRKIGLKTTIIYPGFIYGPYDNNVIPSVVKMLKHGLKFIVSGGEKNAPLVYIDDLCELFYLAIINKTAINKKYISAKGLDVGVHQVMKMIADKLGYSFPTKKYPRIPLLVIAFALESIYGTLKIKSNPPLTRRLVDMLSLNFKKNYDLATKDFGWVQRTTIEDGLQKALKWYLKNYGKN